VAWGKQPVQRVVQFTRRPFSDNSPTLLMTETSEDDRWPASTSAATTSGKPRSAKSDSFNLPARLKATAYLRSIDIVRYRDDRLKVDGPHYSPSQRVMESGEPLTYGLFCGGFNGNLLKMLIK